MWVKDCGQEEIWGILKNLDSHMAQARHLQYDVAQIASGQDRDGW